MTPLEERRVQDLARLRQLCAGTRGKVAITEVTGAPVDSVRLRLLLRTAPSEEFPAKVQSETTLTIQLGERYPYEPPLALVSPPVFHPNVFESGRVCLGDRWMGTETLDLLVRRIVQIVTFDRTVVDADAPANSSAADWYDELLSSGRAPFPSDRVEFGVVAEEEEKRIQWRDVPVPGGEVACACGARLRVPPGTRRWRCPRCQRTAEVAGA